ncbi:MULTISPECIES: ComF family protein [Aphanothece]|uniref:ComF family protein n=1 Tax=Aphanothece TaxID=1121 RepID=UPI003985265D
MALPPWPTLAGLLPLEWLILPAAVEATAAPAAISGLIPMPWWAAGRYEGALRARLLGLRRELRPQRLEPLVAVIATVLRELAADRPAAARPLLVPIPSWKRRANPLPPLVAQLLARELDWPRGQILERSHPVLGQHRLNRELRWANQQDAFRSLMQAHQDRRGRRPVLLVDDILTTGATACSAAMALRQAGWRPLGLACLARTPSPPPQKKAVI